MSAGLYLSESPEERATRAERVSRERVAQGLSPKGDDPVAIAITAEVMRKSRAAKGIAA